MSTNYDVILSPVITEKATRLTEANQVVFHVTLDATKPAIAAAVAGLFHDRHHVERGALVLHRTHRHVAGVVDPEVAGAPPRDVISMKRAGDIPRF